MLRARIGLEKAQIKEKLLRDFTRPKKIKELKSRAERSRSNELAKQAIWDLETVETKEAGATNRRLRDSAHRGTACSYMRLKVSASLPSFTNGSFYSRSSREVEQNPKPE